MKFINHGTVFQQTLFGKDVTACMYKCDIFQNERYYLWDIVCCSEMDEHPDHSNRSVFLVTTRILDLPQGYYIALYLLGSLHLVLSFWMLAEYFVKEKPNLSVGLPSIKKRL